MATKKYSVQTSTVPAKKRNGSTSGYSSRSSSGGSVDLSGIYSLLETKLDTEIFEELFEKVNLGSEDEPRYAIRAKFGLYSDEWVSVYGINQDGVATGGKSYLSDLLDTKITDLESGQVLVYRNGFWVNEKIASGTGGGLDESELAKYLESKKYATQEWVKEQGYLKSVSWGEIEDKPSWIGSSKPSYSFAELTSHPTTLAGYGITDALTFDTANGLFVKKSGDTMTGRLVISAADSLLLSGSNNYIGSNGTLAFYYGESRPSSTVADNVMLRLRGADKVIDGGGNDKVSLGASSFRWSNIYSALGNFSTSITIGKATISWDEDAQGLKIDTGLYSEKWISVYGANNAAGETGKSYLSDLMDVSLSNLSTGQYLMWNGSRWINSTINNATGNYLPLTGGSMSNTNLVTNMNADLLDGVHETGFMRRYTSTIGSTSDTTDLYRSCGYTFSDSVLATSTNGPFIGFGSASYFKVLWGRYGVNALSLRSNNAGTWSEWRDFAFTDSNVASATQLQTTRTLWGQPFNGTANVTGTLSSVEDIYMSGSLYINDTTANSSIRFARAGVNYLWATGGGSGFAFITGGKAKEWANAELVIQDGYVYPGTTNMTQLGASGYRWSHLFSGYGNFSLAVTMGSTLDVAGLITASSGIKIGDGTITWDTSAGGFRFSHGLYSEQWMSVRGLNSGIGSSTGSQTLYTLTFVAGAFTAGSYNPGTSASSVSIPTHTSHLTNNSGYITSSALTGYATTSALASYLPLSGGTMTGNINIGSNKIITSTSLTNACFIDSNTISTYFDYTLTFKGCTNSGTDYWGIQLGWMYLRPIRTENHSLGTSEYRWSTVYAVSGNFTGAVSQNTSDLRLKTDIESVDCLDILSKIGNAFSYRYTAEAVSDRHWLDTSTLHYGFAYQNAIRAEIPGFTGLDDKGYGWINFLSSDMLALMAGGILELYIKQRSIENDVNALRQRINTLESENLKLKERVSELEEA